MGKYVSDGERMAMAMYNKKETELKLLKEELEQFKTQLRVMSKYVWELKKSNMILWAQVNYLVHKPLHNA